jgi:hypothetical protein
MDTGIFVHEQDQQLNLSSFINLPYSIQCTVFNLLEDVPFYTLNIQPVTMRLFIHLPYIVECKN